MNIIYKLTNKSKTSGKRFYVGSKSECKVIPIDGVDTIVQINTGRPYYSSSSCPIFKQDMLNGDVIEAEILEEVTVRTNLIERENYWIDHFDAVSSDEFYNMSTACLNCHNPDAILNVYGERHKDVACRNSSWSKRDSNAKKQGFDNFGEFCLHIWDEAKHKSWAEISENMGKHRHYAKSIVDPYDEDKTRYDLEHKMHLKEELRQHIVKGCSLFHACDLLDITRPAGRIMLGEYNRKMERSYSVAKMRGMSKEEMEIEVTKQILDGKSFREVSNDMGMIYESVKRYFFRCIRKRLKSSDL